MALTQLNPASPFYDPLGIGAILSSLSLKAQTAFHLTNVSQSFVGVTGKPGVSRLFLWGGVSWSPTMVMQRAVWILVAVCIVALASALFNRFDRGWKMEAPLAPIWRWRMFGGSVLGTGLAAELPFLLTELPWVWFVGVGGTFVAALAIPIDLGVRMVLPLSVLFALPAWSNLGVLESRYGTASLIASINGFNSWFCVEQWLAASVFGWIVCSGAILALFAHGFGAQGVARLLVVAALAAIALLCGTLTWSPRLFEISLIVVWFLGPMNGFSALDFTAPILHSPIATILVAIGIGASALIASCAVRSRLIAF